MKSIKEYYDKFIKKHPEWGSFLCFAEAVKHRKYNRRKISYWFNKLVDKCDYIRKEKKQLIDYLVDLSNSND